MQPVDRGGGRRPAGIVLLVLVAIVGAGIAGRLGEAASPSAVPPSPTPKTSASPGEAASVFASIACPPPPMSIVRADDFGDASASTSRLATVAPSAAWLDVVAGRGSARGRSVWVLARGRLVRLDGSTLAATRAWSYADSPIWAPDGISPDASDGVFMWDATGIRDVSPEGAVVVAPVPTSSRIAGVVKGPDGATWIVASADGSSGSAVLRYDAIWARMRPCEPNPDQPAGPATVTSDSGSRLVVVDTFDSSVRIRRFDGRTWTSYVGMEGLGDPQTTPSVATADDGTVYIATGRGIGRFDGTTWSSVRTAATRIAVLDDGSLAAFEPTALGDTAMTHLDGRSLHPLAGQSPALFEGLVTGAANSAAGLVVASPAAIGTGLAVVRFQTPGRSLTIRSVAGDVPWLRGARDRPGAPLLALSHGEAWFGSWQGIAWHLASGKLAPRDVSAGASSTIRALARAADGSIWIGHDADLTVVKPTGASVEVAVDAISIADASAGRVWLLGSDGTALLGSLFPSGVVIDAIARPPFDWGARIIGDPDGSAWALGGSLTGPDLVVVHLVGDRWTVVRRLVGATIITITGDPRHGLWALASRSGGRILLLRDDGSGWRSVGDVPMLAATDLAAGKDGTVWVAGSALARTDGAGRWETVAGSSAIHDMTRRFYAPSVAADGTVYVVCPSGICRFDANGRAVATP